MYTNMQIQDLQETIIDMFDRIDRVIYVVLIPNSADLSKLSKTVLEKQEI